MANKTNIQRTPRGVYFIEVPSDVLRMARLKEGDTMEFLSGSTLSAKKDDIILRKTP
jgi:hypothetical protein